MHTVKTMVLSRYAARFLFLCAVPVFLAGCGDKTVSIPFKVNTAPEGAFVLYQMTGESAPCSGEWILLGNTPLRGIHQFTEEQLESSDKIALKVMHRGYIEQKIEWEGPRFYEEATTKGMIFWAPELIPQQSQ